MSLVRIARHNWDVLAVCDDRGGCPVLDVLNDLEANYRAAVTSMLGLLRNYLPVHGPQRMREPLCKSIGDDIFEFRKEPKGKRLRVAWFYDAGRVVVCTVAFTKAEKLPLEEKARSMRMRALYFEGRKNGTNFIEDVLLRTLAMPISKYRRLIKRVESTRAFWRETALNEFVIDLSERMAVRGLDGRKLAERLKCSAPRVSQVLRGDGNVTLNTLVQFAMATDGVVHIHIADRNVATTWVDEPRDRDSRTGRSRPRAVRTVQAARSRR